jgi:hypothetical protein
VRITDKRGKVSAVKYHVMKVYAAVEVKLHVLLNSALNGGNWAG